MTWEEDTPLEIRQLQWEIIRQKPLEERLRMACEMADLGQRMVRDRLQREHPGWTDGQVRAEAFREIYRDDFPPDQLNELVEQVKSHHERCG